MKPRQILLIVAVAVVIAAAAIFLLLKPALSPTLPQTAATASSPATPPAPSGTDSELMVAGPLGEKTLGDPKAPNTVIEYASMTCTHCQRFNNTVFKQFKAKYIDTGKVYYIFREFPLDPLATSASMLARCAPPDRYFAVVDLLYEKQSDWAFVQDPESALRDLMKQVGFSQADFDTCLKNQTILDGVNWVKDRAAQKFSIDGTPTFFFNGQKKEGEQTLEDIDKILAG